MQMIYGNAEEMRAAYMSAKHHARKHPDSFEISGTWANYDRYPDSRYLAVYDSDRNMFTFWRLSDVACPFHDAWKNWTRGFITWDSMWAAFEAIAEDVSNG